MTNSCSEVLTEGEAFLKEIIKLRILDRKPHGTYKHLTAYDTKTIFSSF